MRKPIFQGYKNAIHDGYIEDVRKALEEGDGYSLREIFEKILYEEYEITVAKHFAYWPAVADVETVWDDAGWEDDEVRSYGEASDLMDEVLESVAPSVRDIVWQEVGFRAEEYMNNHKNEGAQR